MAIIFLLAATAATGVLLGPAAGGIAFLAIALVRVALRARALELENEELRRRVRPEDQPFDSVDAEAMQLDLFREPTSEAPPQSGMRPSVTNLAARRISGES